MASLQSRVVSVIENDDELRALVAVTLGQRGHTTRGFASGRQFLQTLDPRQPGCLVMDLGLPDMDGRELLREVRSRGSRQPVLVMTGIRVVEEVLDILRMGAKDILLKPIDLGQLTELVDKALNEDEQIRSQLTVEDRLASLTRREREVAELVARGMITKEIARSLGISRKTVEVHRSRIVQKLGTGSVPQIVRMVSGHLPGLDLREQKAAH